MAKVSITADVEVYEENLDERIISAAAEQLLGQLELTARYGGRVAALIEEKLSEIAAARIEQMLDREVTQVDRWGEVVSGPRKTFPYYH